MPCTLHCIASVPLSKPGWRACLGAAPGSTALSPWSTCIFFRQHRTVWVPAATESLKIGGRLGSSHLLLLQNCLSYSSSSAFPYTLSEHLVCIYKKSAGVLVATALICASIWGERTPLLPQVFWSTDEQCVPPLPHTSFGLFHHHFVVFSIQVPYTFC